MVLHLNNKLQEEKNPDLLQESEEQGSEEANYDSDVNAEANKLMKTTMALLFQWNKSRRLSNIKKQWK